jgi:hypothetical protein
MEVQKNVTRGGEHGPICEVGSGRFLPFRRSEAPCSDALRSVTAYLTPHIPNTHLHNGRRYVTSYVFTLSVLFVFLHAAPIFWWFWTLLFCFCGGKK